MSPEARRHERPMARPKTAWRDEIWDRKMQFVILALFLFLMAAVAIATACSEACFWGFAGSRHGRLPLSPLHAGECKGGSPGHSDSRTSGLGKPLICDAV